jgi:exopolysaccharide biosynthesis predicted pyruvyltransferase EpsI
MTPHRITCQNRLPATLTKEPTPTRERIWIDDPDYPRTGDRCLRGTEYCFVDHSRDTDDSCEGA